MTGTKKRGKVSLGDVAKAAGVTRAAVSYALRGTRGVSPATRQQILRIADDLGYARDPKMSSWMARVQQARGKELWPIAWLNDHKTEEGLWRELKYLSPYLEGAQDRALELGHRVEEIWAPENNVKSRHLAEYLRERGIKGVIVTHRSRHFRMDWTNLAGVALEGRFFAPSLHRVMTDYYYNLQLALKMVKRAGYRRIGVCLDQALDGISSHSIAGAMGCYNDALPAEERVPALFYQRNSDVDCVVDDQVTKWMRKERPEVVIGHSNLMVEWVRQAGFSVPDQMGVIHLATDDDVTDWAGVWSNRREVGAMAVELLISRIEERQFGRPRVPSKTLIRGTWSPGWTLRRL